MARSPKGSSQPPAPYEGAGGSVRVAIRLCLNLTPSPIFH